MAKIVVKGGNGLKGSVKISGAKNSALALIPVSILIDGNAEFVNVPNVEDVRTMLELLSVMGSEVSFDKGNVFINTSNIKEPFAPYEFVSKMRASIYVLGPLLARFKRAKVALPGGCAFGPRPINFHLEGLRKMGAEIEIEHGYIIAKAKELRGAYLTFEKKSVGATIHLMTTAVFAKGETVIDNAAIEPEVVDVAKFLKKCGANIEGEGTDTIRVYGGGFLKGGIKYGVIPDRIEAATFIIASLITNGEVRVEGIRPKDMGAVISKLMECGGRFEIGEDYVLVKPSGRLEAKDVETAPFPGFPTDVQPQYMALMSVSNGKSLIKEGIYPDRFKHAFELIRLGANIKVGEGFAIVEGVESLSGAPVVGSDLRATASLVLAGLVAKGITEVDGYEHMLRGYENFEEKIRNLGAELEVIF
ncbi:MAG: UDP-N-acetylglucosamine 1-carboxyvinyltransferase [candidate division WOR-3 bacterium]